MSSIRAFVETRRQNWEQSYRRGWVSSIRKGQEQGCKVYKDLGELKNAWRPEGGKLWRESGKRGTAKGTIAPLHLRKPQEQLQGLEDRVRWRRSTVALSSGLRYLRQRGKLYWKFTKGVYKLYRFCFVLISYPAVVTERYIRSHHFLMESLESYKHRILPTANKEYLTASLFICTLFLSLVLLL